VVSSTSASTAASSVTTIESITLSRDHSRRRRRSRRTDETLLALQSDPPIPTPHQSQLHFSAAAAAAAVGAAGGCRIASAYFRMPDHGFGSRQFSAIHTLRLKICATTAGNENTAAAAAADGQCRYFSTHIIKVKVVNNPRRHFKCATPTPVTEIAIQQERTFAVGVPTTTTTTTAASDSPK
jgi:hypothetical protein